MVAMIGAGMASGSGMLPSFTLSIGCGQRVNSPRVQSAHDARVATPQARRCQVLPCLAVPGHSHLRGMGPVPVRCGPVMPTRVCVTNAAQYTTRHAE